MELVNSIDNGEILEKLNFSNNNKEALIFCCI